MRNQRSPPFTDAKIVGTLGSLSKETVDFARRFQGEKKNMKTVCKCGMLSQVNVYNKLLQKMQTFWIEKIQPDLFKIYRNNHCIKCGYKIYSNEIEKLHSDENTCTCGYCYRIRAGILYDWYVENKRAVAEDSAFSKANYFDYCPRCGFKLEKYPEDHPKHGKNP